MTLELLALPAIPARTLPPSKPNEIGRWLATRIAGDEYKRLSNAARQDLRTIALMLEAWEAPKRRKWWRVWA